MKNAIKILNNIKTILRIKALDSTYSEVIFESIEYKDCLYNKRILKIDLCKN